MDSKPKRYEDLKDYSSVMPIHVVWEITLACNLKCSHCGSRAGKVRPNELTLQQCFEVIEHLAELGTREITIIGGEAFLRKDWIEIIRKITSEGIDCSMQTGAYNLTEQKIIDAKNAGIKNIGVSIDGLETTHNEIRGRSKSFEFALLALELLQKHGITSSVNTTITQNNRHELEPLLDTFVSYNVKNWQVQLMVAMGNAVDNDHLLIQPFEIIELHDELFRLYKKALVHDLIIQPGNNIGYFGPYEHSWRQGTFNHFIGCSAGHTTIGIEADGKVKGCPSLPSSDYTGGNVKNMSIKDIWKHTEELSFTRNRTTKELWGGCKSCYYSEVCMSGCTWTSHVLFGKRGNNPFCYHRATELKKKGLKEKITKVSGGTGNPFDYGKFVIQVINEENEIVEIQNGNDTIKHSPKSTKMREIKKLKLCRGCSQHVYADTKICPFCTSDIDKVNKDFNEKFKEVEKAYSTLINMMESK